MVVLAFLSCTKKQEQTELNSVSYRASGQAGSNKTSNSAEANAAYERDPFAAFLEELPDIAKNYKGGVRQNFPAKYLADPLVFKDIPLTSPYPGKALALVGYDKAKLYSDPFKAGKKGAVALQDLKVLSSIPIGTVLPILGEYRDDLSDTNDQTGL